MRISDWSSDVCSSDLSLPAGYEPMNRPVQMDYARFPFWTGQAFEWVEGRSYEAAIAAADGKTWSEFELRKNLEALLRSEEHTSELQSLMRISYAVFCLKKKKNDENIDTLVL